MNPNEFTSILTRKAQNLSEINRVRIYRLCLSKKSAVKTISLILILFSPVFLCSCNAKKPENFSDLKAVSQYAMQYYKENKPEASAHLTLALGDEEWQTAEIREKIRNIKDFSYIWVHENYTVFWNDETKTYGVLYAEKPVDTIKNLRSWYVSLRVNCIEKNWFEIGQLGTI